MLGELDQIPKFGVGGPRRAAKRERRLCFVPGRHVTVFQAAAGSARARAWTATGRWFLLRRKSLLGRPTPCHFGCANGASPGFQTLTEDMHAGMSSCD